MLTHQQITAKVESAFLPLRCVVQITNDGRKLRFKVFNRQDKVVLSMRGVVLSEMRQEKQLDAVLHFGRSRIRAKGFALQKLQAAPPASLE
jgi:hypothetical protein